MKQWENLLGISLFLLTLGLSVIHAQPPDQEWHISTISEGFEEFLASQPDSIAEKHQKGIERYLWFYRDRVDPDGFISNPFQGFGPADPNAPAGSVPFCSGSDPADWSLVGPESISSQEMGLVDEIYVPADESYYLIGASMGGLWKRTPGNPTWRNVTDQLNVPLFKVSSIVGDPFDQDHIYATVGGTSYEENGGRHGMGIIESFDGGDTWAFNTGFNIAMGNNPYVNVVKIIIDVHRSVSSSQLWLFAITGRHLLQSTNSGATWVVLSQPGHLADPGIYSNWYELEADHIGNLFLTSRNRYAPGAKLWKNDALSGWIDLTTNISVDTAIRMKLTEPNGGTIYALIDVAGRKVMRSIDYGFTWTNLGLSVGGAGPKMEIEYSPLKNKLYIGGLHCYRHDLTLTSTSFVSQGHVDIRDIYFVNTPSSDLHVYTANDGGASLVVDGAFGYSSLNGDHLPITEFYDVGTHDLFPDRFVSGCTHNNTFVKRFGTWYNVFAGDGNASIIDWGNADQGYITGNHLIRKYIFSSGNTINIDPINSTNTRGGGTLIGITLEQDPVDSSIVYYARNTDGNGNNWLNIYFDSGTKHWENRNIPYVSRIGAFKVAPSNNLRSYLAEYKANNSINKLLRSDDFANTWISLGQRPVQSASGTFALNQVLGWRRISDIAIAPYDEDKVWFSVTGFAGADEEYRVLRSEDGAGHLTDYSEGLPRFPVHSLVYMEGTNDLLFAGTETGVYYRDASMSQWECFAENMPMAIITDLDINYCTHELIASTYGRGIWKTTIPADLSELVITTSQTFTGAGLDINANIRIKPGATLTVQGELRMGKNKRIIVERGAALVVDGGRLTNNCEALWAGIEVWGNSTEPQQPETILLDPEQGTVVMKNGAILENAINGITTQNLSAAGYHGGRIFAINSSFLNNRFSVEMLSYAFPNESYFNNCTFECTGPLVDPGYVDAFGRSLGTATHVRLWDVHNIEFQANTFVNSGSFDHDIRGIGIHSLDADYFVIGSCNAFDANGNCVDFNPAFVNLTKGIEFTSSTGGHQVSIIRNQFDNVVQGVYLNGGTANYVSNNNFIDFKGSTSFGPFFLFSWGVYAESTFGATVQDNNFQTGAVAALSPLFFPRAVIANNTGSFVTEVKRNVFGSGQLIGVHAFNDNSEIVVRCNDFYSDLGIVVTTPNSSNPSLFPTQGQFSFTDDRLMAGNQFHKVCNNNFNHIFYQARNNAFFNLPWLLYWHHSAPPPVDPQCITSGPFYWVFPISLAPALSATSCVDPPAGGGSLKSVSITTSRPSMPDQILGSPEPAVIRAQFETADTAAIFAAFREYREETEWSIESIDQLIAQHNVSNASRASRQEEIRAISALINAGAYDQLADTLARKEHLESFLLGASSMMGQDYDIAATILEMMPAVNERQNGYEELNALMVKTLRSGRSFFEWNAAEIGQLQELASLDISAASKARGILDFIGIKDNSPYVDEIHTDHRSVCKEKLAEYCKIYPNPNEGRFTFVVSNELAPQGKLEIYNNVGMKVKTIRIKDSNTPIDLSDQENGVYHIRSYFMNKVETNKVVLLK